MEMRRENGSVFLRAGLSQELFSRLSDFIYRESGIKMPLTKKTMLEARLQKRLRSMGLTSYDEYCSYLFSPEGIANELVHMIDVVTTNKTDFFREAQHFEYLIEHVLPSLVQSRGAGIRRPFMAWSAACSSGEEPYTLAMVLDQFSRRARGFTFQVLGTDISTRVLETARDGIYHEERIEQIPLELRRSYFMKSRDRSRRLVRVVPELRAHVKFRRLNFMEDDFGMREKMDVVFCRNVLIYFDRPTQEAVINRICGHLHSGGYLFTGHSETINGMKVPLTPVANTVSRRI
ncbi:MAG TPA: protein-glutamate O-methyltransferase [Deltaproteobacteria bacterium]|jgi:chemotaxis protein methyltransferase CheR|nr:protein-glutamate O-methyltransferase [Deltaproteobacteria bacterium]HOD70972.1 protein-glutamate O-methyltransferase [Deltaproteobacteria bacterium]HOE72120.1 protein-glutamate O-methyltransferase [Deltaproteobacteria bacterium]HOS26211.1 protein-glutamate O-methyltransferase [Deltaproteobacteria bacterium]HPL86089.1 protein-glutamate O-methyltransferase [Deltaproteobacteria bacterium]